MSRARRVRLVRAAAGLAAGMAACSGCGDGPVRLGPGRPLSASLRALEVTRIGPGGERLGSRFDPARLPAPAMHERGVEPPEGEVHGRWVLGEPAWDAVGWTRQRSDGEPADGLWAHPRDGTELWIEADVVIEGPALEGFFGLTDFSLAHAGSRGVEAPVRFALSLDGQTRFAAEARRRPGWSHFRVALPDAGPRLRRLGVRVASDDDTWAHFVFDLRAAAE